MQPGRMPRERAVNEAAAGEVIVGPKRTPTQDVEFSIGVLVEIAVRACRPASTIPAPR